MLPPLGDTADQASAWVRNELLRALPRGWCVTGFDGTSPLRGDVATIESRNGPITTCYGVRIAAGLDLLVFTWGNSDAGARPLAEQAMSRALVLDAYLARTCGLQSFLERLFTDFPPNTYGFT